MTQRRIWLLSFNCFGRRHCQRLQLQHADNETRKRERQMGQRRNPTTTAWRLAEQSGRVGKDGRRSGAGGIRQDCGSTFETVECVEPGATR